MNLTQIKNNIQSNEFYRLVMIFFFPWLAMSCFLILFKLALLCRPPLRFALILLDIVYLTYALLYTFRIITEKHSRINVNEIVPSRHRLRLWIGFLNALSSIECYLLGSIFLLPWLFGIRAKTILLTWIVLVSIRFLFEVCTLLVVNQNSAARPTIAGQAASLICLSLSGIFLYWYIK